MPRSTRQPTRNLGRFWVDDDYINTGRAAELFTKLEFVPRLASHEARNQRYAYIGSSPMFSKVLSGQTIPAYELEWADDGSLLVCQPVKRHRLKVEKK